MPITKVVSIVLFALILFLGIRFCDSSVIPFMESKQDKNDEDERES